MNSIFRGAVVLLVLLLASAVRAEDRPVPGLEMDALSARTVEAWRKQVARAPIRFAEAAVTVKRPGRRDLPAVVEGTYRFDLATGKISWSEAVRGGMMEQAWWRHQLDWILREPGLRFYLAHSKLRATQLPEGVEIQATGRSPLQVLRFDDRGLLVGLTAKMAVPAGGAQQAEITLSHERLGEHLLLTKYVSDTPAPGGLRGIETGRIGWRLVHGRPLPTSIGLDVRQGRHKLALVVELGPWRLEKEAQARTDAVSAKVMRFWENREYNLGRRDFATARCDLEFEDGNAIARGTYQWDGTTGSATWQDPELAERLGTQWRKTLDDVFRRYPLREDLGVRDLVGSKADGRTVVRVEDVLPGTPSPGYQRLVFGSDSTLRRVELVRPDGTAGVLTPTWRRIEYPNRHIFAGMLLYMAPSRWSAVWTRIDGSTYQTTRSISYAGAQGAHVPSRLAIQFAGDGVRARTLVFRFRNWKLTKHRPLRGR